MVNYAHSLYAHILQVNVPSQNKFLHTKKRRSASKRKKIKKKRETFIFLKHSFATFFLELVRYRAK